MVTPPPARRGSPGEAGYNLVLLIMIVAVLGILVAAALPTWSSAIQREKEEELIFRGLQYAEAIRVFQKRFGRPPVRLGELIEVEPRSIRKLWKDPLTGKQEWGLVFANAGGPARPGGPGQAADPEGRSNIAIPGATEGGKTVTQGPISGVHSLAQGEAIKTFAGKSAYSEWVFTVDMLDAKINQGPIIGAGPTEIVRGVEVGKGPPDLSSRWIGRPWPAEIEQQMMAAPGNVPGGAALPGGGGSAVPGPDGRATPKSRRKPPGGR